uniref:ABC transmembrane type-1 domain-containing protein n=1 Tax=Steinernema glaseri TaxID=37863 RepID=A0A1I8AJA3_9BILA
MRDAAANVYVREEANVSLLKPFIIGRVQQPVISYISNHYTWRIGESSTIGSIVGSLIFIGFFVAFIACFLAVMGIVFRSLIARNTSSTRILRQAVAPVMNSDVFLRL